MKNKKYQFEIEENNVIRAAIAPMGIDFRPNTRFYMGDYICRIYAIMQYPPIPMKKIITMSLKK